MGTVDRINLHEIRDEVLKEIEVSEGFLYENEIKDCEHSLSMSMRMRRTLTGADGHSTDIPRRDRNS